MVTKISAKIVASKLTTWKVKQNQARVLSSRKEAHWKLSMRDNLEMNAHRELLAIRR